MEKGLLFFTISVACLWLVLDEFFGTKRISNMALNLTPNLGETVGEKIDNVIHGTNTLEDKINNQQAIKEKVDNNDSIKTKAAKDAVKKAIDQYYEFQGVGST